MTDSIRDYLDRLRAELAGADPAVVQDALYDAEEYLRGEVDAAAAGGAEPDVAAIVERYGEPAEIAAAYLEQERIAAAALRRPAAAFGATRPMPAAPSARTGTPTAPLPAVPAAGGPRAAARSVLGRFFGVLADPHAWGSLFYMLLALVTGIAYFTIVVAGLSMSLGMMVLIIGVPILLLFIGVVRAVSFLEGRLVEGMLGERMPRRPRSVPRQGDVWERIKSWFTDYRTWTSMLYMVLQLPVGIVYFTTVVIALSMCAYAIISPVAQVLFNTPVAQSYDYYYYFEYWAMPLVMLAGVAGFVVLMHVVRLVGRVQSAYAKVMLVGRVHEVPMSAGTASSDATQPGGDVSRG